MTARTRNLDGSLHPDFQPVADVLRDQIKRYPGGAAACVYHRGECVVDLWGGVRDETGHPWMRDTMSPSFSTTKGVATTLVHRMVDQGLLDYDDMVAKHWPEFAQAGKERITVRHVLSHQSGLYHIRQMIDSADRMLDWEHMIAAIERTPPIHRPGERTGYHGLTYGFIVGEILRRVTGRPFPQLVQEEIAGPLGLDGLYIGAPEDALPRAAKLIWPPESWFSTMSLVQAAETGPGSTVLAGVGSILHRALRLGGVEFDAESLLDALAPRGIKSFDFGGADTLRAAIPAANGLFTARSLARMYAALAGGGEIDGVRLISRETLRRATELQEPTKERRVIPFDMRWRLGWHGVFTLRGVVHGAYGHFGFGGSGAWADPGRELSAALIVNSGMGTPFGDLRIVRITSAVLESASARRRSLVRSTAAARPALPAPATRPESAAAIDVASLHPSGLAKSSV